MAMDTQALKVDLAAAVAQRARDGETLGIGTGSTVDCVVEALAGRIKQGLAGIRAITSSLETAWQCERAGIEVLYDGFKGVVDWGFDGADEVDPANRLIKGGGGAMLREKIVACRCQKFIVLIDESKIVRHLGERVPVPIEVIPEALPLVEKGLERLKAKEWSIREGRGKHGPVITESGNLIIDARFSSYPDTLEHELRTIVGVVETGLFFGYADEIMIARAGGIETRIAQRSSARRSS